MFHMLIGLMTWFFLVFSIITDLILMVVPGLVSRFIIKRRPLTLEERKIFRRKFAIIASVIAVIIAVPAFFLNPEWWYPIVIILLSAAETAKCLFTNTMILKISKKGAENPAPVQYNDETSKSDF